METQRPLSEDQMEQFRTFGFLAFPGLLADCIDRIIEEFEAIWAAHGGGHDGRRGSGGVHQSVGSGQCPRPKFAVGCDGYGGVRTAFRRGQAIEILDSSAALGMTGMGV